MARGEIGIVKVQGRELTVVASTDGTWQLKLGTSYIGFGDTLDQAKAQARKAFKKDEVKVEVPFLRQRTRGYGDRSERVVEYGVADSLHAGNDKVLAEIEGERETLNISYGRGTGIWKPDTPRDLIEHYNELEDARNRIYEEMKKIDDEWSLDLRRVVRDAINEAAEKESA